MTQPEEGRVNCFGDSRRKQPSVSADVEGKKLKYEATKEKGSPKHGKDK
jgi:hypothetical protein